MQLKTADLGPEVALVNVDAGGITFSVFGQSIKTLLIQFSLTILGIALRVKHERQGTVQPAAEISRRRCFDNSRTYPFLGIWRKSSMLSEIEMSRSATAFVGNDAVDEVDEGPTVFAAPRDALRLSRKGSPSERDSFFYMAMRISQRRVRAYRSDRKPVIT